MGHSGVEGGARSLAGALARLDVDGAGDERTEGAGDERTEEMQLGDTPRRLSTLRYESRRETTESNSSDIFIELCHVRLKNSGCQIGSTGS